MEGHDLVLMVEPAKSPYCCNGCKEKDVRPCYKHAGHGSYHLHRECYDSCKTPSIVFNLNGSNSSCDYAFHKEALGGKGVCEACGGDVKGWFFKCKLCKKPHYLHPCCAKLPIKNYLETGEENIIMDLKAKSPGSECLLCGSKESSHGFSGCYYISRCGRYCYHWSCIKQVALKKWKEDDGDDDHDDDDQPSRKTKAETVTIQHTGQGKQKQGHGAGEKSEALPTKISQELTQASKDPKKGPSSTKAVLVFTAEVAVQLLNIFISLIFGLPPLPFDLVLKFFK